MTWLTRLLRWLAPEAGRYAAHSLAFRARQRHAEREMLAQALKPPPVRRSRHHGSRWWITLQQQNAQERRSWLADELQAMLFG